MNALPKNAMHAEKTARKQRGRPFAKGVSGNPSGRPRGSLSRTTRAYQELLEGEGEAITRKAIELAKKGDIQALRLCLDRILPPRRERSIEMEIPVVNVAKDIPLALGAVVETVVKGDLTLSEGQAVASLLESQRKAFETAELEQRVEAIEVVLKARKK